MHHALLAPEHQQRHGQPAPELAVFAVMLQIDACRCAVVLAHAVRAALQRQAALVLGQRPGIEGREAGAAPAHDLAHIGGGIGLDQALGQRRGLDEEEPVPVGARKGLAGLLVHGQRGRNVQQHQTLHAGGIVHGQPVRHARAPVMRQHAEMLMAQPCHQPQQVAGHGALAVVHMLGVAGRARGVAIAAQVGQHQGELLRQPGRDAVPDGAGLRVAVHQQQGRPLAAHPGVDLHPVIDRDALLAQARHPWICVHPGDSFYVVHDCQPAMLISKPGCINSKILH